MGRELDFDMNQRCSICGDYGVWDYMGDPICPKCLREKIKKDKKEKNDET